MNERVPQHVQNIVVRNYCHTNNYKYLLSATEYVMENCHLILKQTILEYKSFDGIVLYSLFQLPELKKDRLSIINELIDKEKELHFAVENIKLKNTMDLEHINALWEIKQTIEK